MYEKGYGLMSTKGLKKIEKFKEIGSFEVKSRRGRKSIALTTVEDAATVFQEAMSNDVHMCSVQEFA